MSLPAVRVGNSCGEKRREPPAQTAPLRLRLSCVQSSGSPVQMAVAVCRVRHCKQTSLLHMNDPRSRTVAGQLLCALSLLLAWGYTQILVDQLTQPVPVTPTPHRCKTFIVCMMLLCKVLWLVMHHWA